MQDCEATGMWCKIAACQIDLINALLPKEIETTVIYSDFHKG